MGIFSHKINGVAFGTYSAEDIRRLSVKRITNPVTFDALMHPTPGGLYDPALGPLENKDVCRTCSLIGTHCPGHIGHVELPLVVFNPIFFHQMFALLRAMCRVCHRFKAPKTASALLVAQLKLLDVGLLVAAREMAHCLDGDPAGVDALERIDAAYHQHMENAGLNPDVIIPNATSKSVNNETYRRELIREFLSAAVSSKTCPHCKAAARGLSHESCVKVFAKPLKAKLHAKMASMNLLERTMIPKDAQGYIRVTEVATSNSKDDVESDDSSSEDEDENGSSNRLTQSGSESSGSSDDSSDESSSDSDEGVESESDAVTDKQQMDTSADVKSTENGSSLRIPSGPTKATAAANVKIFITPVQAREHLLELWTVEYDVISRMFTSLVTEPGAAGSSNRMFRKRSSPDAFFLSVLPVPANRFRPASRMGDKTFENPQTVALTAILKDCVLLQELNAAKMSEADKDAAEFERRRLERLSQAWQSLQGSVNVFMDSSMSTKSAGEDNPGIRQSLERKEGLFRMHMMGKRVNYAARSVISPDPMIGTHEIGVPHTFAIRLTYPEPVTTFNLPYLRQCVINGPQQHPGATHIETEDGNLIKLPFDKEKRTALADQLLTPQGNEMSSKSLGLPKRVYRHIRNGDWVLMNRQPTLHKSSIMAHQVRVLPGERTLRLHYANCKTFNADFDGDEMNLHFPQSEAARAEAMCIAATHHQYIGLAGGPLRGLIQDHLIAAVRMTCRDAFYDKTHYQMLVYNALPERYDGKALQTLKPAILKPKALWTGKQIISTILLNLTQGEIGLNLVSKAKIKNEWAAASMGVEGESTVIVRNCELLCGVLDKNQCGATANGLVHAIFELYGGETASAFLTAVGKLWSFWLKYHAASLSIDDLLLTDEANKKRRELIDASGMEGQKAAAKYVNQEDYNDIELLRSNLETILHDPSESKGLDSAMMGVANKTQSQVIQATLPQGLIKQFPHNFFQLMVQSGAKGSPVNATQISCMLGQQALEGRRVPTMPSGKTLPSFTAFDPALRAGGMVMDRFLTGLRPQEYYFHCMAGREGLVDTAVKTSRSGYLQRCLIKHLEDLRVNYDMTVRDADGSVVQFRYGEDALDVTKVSTLTNFSFLKENYIGFLDKFNAQQLPQVFEGEFGKRAIKLQKKAIANPKKYGPVLSSLRPDTYFGCVSEEFYKKVLEYAQKLAESGDGITQRKFQTLMYLKSLYSLAHPGEPVGILAAQAIGEPSTQMTLNTFHFAGRGEVNVTLGIPRLREIVMTASKESKTPIMRVPLVDTAPAKKRAVKVAASLQPVTLGDVLQSVEVTEELGAKQRGERRRNYHIKLTFISREEYQEKCEISPDSLLSTLEQVFIKQLPKLGLRSVQKKAKLDDEDVFTDEVSPIVSSDAAEADNEGADEPEAPKKGSKAMDEEEEDSDDDEEDVNPDDAGTLSSSAKSKHAQGGSYEADADDNDGDTMEDEGTADHGEADVKKQVDTKKSVAKRADRINDVVGGSVNITEYDYDENGEWMSVTVSMSASLQRIMFVSLIEETARKIVVRATRGVKRCALVKSSEAAQEDDILQVEGLNIRALWKHADVLDLNKLNVNDVQAMLDTYGVEAARAAIIRELNAVFSVYGIGVNFRHLSLVSDYMTFEGDYRGMNRISMKANVSPFHKMSFETTTDFLRTATLTGDFEELKSNSSRLVVGKVCSSGTGAMDVLQPLDL